MKLIDVLSEHKDGKSENRTFGLVIQGGGMRAAYSAGSILPLVDAGLSEAFDHVIGSSAGALNGAYLIGSNRDTYTTYSESLTNTNFVNTKRLGRVVDIDYLIDVVLKHKHPINKQKLKKSKSKLHIVLTNSQDGTRKIISDHNEFVDIYEEFRATAAIPILYDKFIKIGDSYYIDGGITDLIPVDIALDLGCTDIFVIMTQKLEFYHFDRTHTRLVNNLMRRFARKYPKAVRKQLPTNEITLRQNLETISNPPQSVNMYVLEPSNDDLLVSRISIDKQDIRELAELGVNDMEEYLHKDVSEILNQE